MQFQVSAEDAQKQEVLLECQAFAMITHLMPELMKMAEY